MLALQVSFLKLSPRFVMPNFELHFLLNFLQTKIRFARLRCLKLLYLNLSSQDYLQKLLFLLM